MQKATYWSIGAKRYQVTSEQMSALESEESRYESLLQDRADEIADDERYDGLHIGNAPDPFRDIRDEHFAAVREILGPNPKCIAPDT